MLWVPLIAGLAVVLTVIQARLRADHPEWATLIALAFAVVVLLGLLPRLMELINAFTGLAAELRVQTAFFSPILKTIAIAYITSFGAQISRDAGEETIASVVELAGKLVIMLIALPVIQAILQSLLGILN